jgi:hypothetical protein
MEYPPYISKARHRLQHPPQWGQNDQPVIILMVDRPVVNITHEAWKSCFACGSMVLDKKKNKDRWQTQKVVQSAYRQLR